MMELGEYCDWLEKLTNSGDTINANGLKEWIEDYAKKYHEDQVALINSDKEEGLNTSLTLEFIESFNLPKERWTPDHDDSGYTFTLPCGINLNFYVVCNGEPANGDSLEGLGGWVYIDTEEELSNLMDKSLIDIFNDIKSNEVGFNINEFKEEYGVEE